MRKAGQRTPSPPRSPWHFGSPRALALRRSNTYMRNLLGWLGTRLAQNTLDSIEIAELTLRWPRRPWAWWLSQATPVGYILCYIVLSYGTILYIMSYYYYILLYSTLSLVLARRPLAGRRGRLDRAAALRLVSGLGSMEEGYYIWYNIV